MLDFFLFPDNEHHPKKEPSAEEIEERERQSLLSEYDYLFLAVKDRIRLAGEENDPCSDYQVKDAVVALVRVTRRLFRLEEMEFGEIGF